MQEISGELKLRGFLEHAKGKVIDVAASVYEIIMESENPIQLFEWFLENVGDIKSVKDQEVGIIISQEQFDMIQQSSDTMIAGILENILLEYLPKKEFYRVLWERIFSNDILFQKKEQKIYALLKIWKDNRIPYCEIEPGLKMKNDEYKEIIGEKRSEIKKSIFITFSKFEQKTQRSSLFFKLLEECKDEKEKIVLLSVILSLVEKKAQNDILDKVKEAAEQRDE